MLLLVAVALTGAVLNRQQVIAQQAHTLHVQQTALVERQSQLTAIKEQQMDQTAVAEEHAQLSAVAQYFAAHPLPTVTPGGGPYTDGGGS